MTDWERVARQSERTISAAQRPDLGSATGAFETTTGRPQGLDAPREVFDSPNPAGFFSSAAANLADDTDTQIRHFAAKRFPTMPPEEAIKRFGVVNGDIVYMGADGNLFREESGIASDVGKFVGESGLPIAGALGIGVPTGALGAGLGGAGGEALRKVAANALLDEPQTMGGNVADIAGEGAVNAVGFKLGSLLSKNVVQRRVASDIAKVDTAKAERLMAIAKRENINLTPAEATNLASLKGDQLALSKTHGPAGDVMGDFLENRATKQIPEAIERHIPGTAPLDVVGDNLQKAASAGLQAAKDVRSEAAAPLFDAARQSGVTVDAKPVIALVDDMLASAKGPIRSALKRVRVTLFNTGKTKAPDKTVAGLQQAKLSIDEMLSKTGDSAVGNTSRRNLTLIKERLLQQLNEASPDFAAANKTFAELSPAVDQVKNSLVGMVSKIKNEKARSAVSRIFSPDVRSGELAFARRVIEKADPKAWEEGLNQYLRLAWERSSQESAVGAASNAAGNFRKAVFGTPRLKANIKAAMGEERFRSFANLLDVLQATSRASGGQSVTHFAQQGEKAFQRKASPIIARTTRLRDFWINMRSEDFKEKMAQIITSPDAMRVLPELRKLPKNSEAAINVVSMLMLRSGVATAADFIESPEDRLPETVTEQTSGTRPRTPRR